MMQQSWCTSWAVCWLHRWANCWLRCWYISDRSDASRRVILVPKLSVRAAVTRERTLIRKIFVVHLECRVISCWASHARCFMDLAIREMATWALAKLPSVCTSCRFRAILPSRALLTTLRMLSCVLAGRMLLCKHTRCVRRKAVAAA